MARRQSATPAASVAPPPQLRDLIDQLLDSMGRRRGDVELPEGALDPGAGPVPTAMAPPGAAPDGGERDVIAQVMEAMGRRRGGDVALPDPAAPAAATPMPAPAPALSPQAVPMAAAQAAAPAPAPAATPTAAPAPSSAQPKVVHVEGLGYLLLQNGQTIEQAIEAKRAGKSAPQNKPSELALRAGSADMPGSKVVGLTPPANWMDELPPEMAALVKGVIRAVPQLASIGTDLAPATRIPKAALGLTVPPLMQLITNLMEGKPWDEGVPEEIGLAALGSGPRIVGSAMAGGGLKRTREALGTSPRIGQLVEEHGKDFVEEVLPRRAIATQARATKDGVADIVDRAADMTGDAKNLKWEARNLSKEAEDMLKGVRNPTAGERALQESKRAEYLSVAERARVADRAATIEHALGNTVENLRFDYAMTGAKGGPSAIVPGSGLASQLGTAAGLPTNVARVVGPAAGWFKGSPVRKLHAATRMARPLGIDPEQYGQILSNVMRANYAGKQATGIDSIDALVKLLTPADPAPRRRKP